MDHMIRTIWCMVCSIPFIGPLHKKDEKIFFVRIASFLNPKNFTFENISIDDTFSENKRFRLFIQCLLKSWNIIEIYLIPAKNGIIFNRNDLRLHESNAYIMSLYWYLSSELYDIGNLPSNRCASDLWVTYDQTNLSIIFILIKLNITWCQIIYVHFWNTL